MPADIPDPSQPSARFPSSRNLRRLAPYLRGSRGQLVALFVLAAVGTCASIAVPLLIRRVIDGPVREGDTRGLLFLGGLALALGVFESMLSFIRRWMAPASALRMETALRRDIFAHLQRLPVSFHDRWQTGQLLSRATSDLSVIRRFMVFGLVFFGINLLTYAIIVVLLLRLYWPLGLLVGLASIPLFFVSKRFTDVYIGAARDMQDVSGDLATQSEEAALGIRAIRSFGRREHVAAAFADGARKVHDAGIRKSRMLATTWAQFDLIPSVTLGIVLVAGALAVAKGDLTLGSLVAFVSLQVLLIWPIDLTAWIIANAQEAMSAADRICEVLDEEPAIVDRPGAVAVARDEVRGHVRFEGVSFSYGPTTSPVLRRIDLDVAPGETVAIVGATGCGKTSLVSLVPRLYDVTSGRITIDGRDVRDHTLESLRTIVGVAFEDPTLFSMSVRENLALGRPDATDGEIAEALDVAQASFVYDLPWGLDTRVGEQGLTLSGGQRQRVALARAVLSRPRVLVLDDPLSALDVHTEALVEEALKRVLAGTTALLVVHRPSTVSLADRVAFLRDGVLAAVGTHSDLLEREPAYRAVLSQAADDQEALTR